MNNFIAFMCKQRRFNLQVIFASSWWSFFFTLTCMAWLTWFVHSISTFGWVTSYGCAVGLCACTKKINE